MIKKITLFTILLSFLGLSFANFEIPGRTTIYTESADQVLDSSNIDDPIRDGAFKAINAQDNNPDHTIGGLVSVDSQIESHETAKLQTLDIIRNILNYVLGLVSLVALIYMIYHGMMVLTAAGDDTQYKKGLKGIKLAAIALSGIGLSWIIVSAIFRVISGSITGTF